MVKCWSGQGPGQDCTLQSWRWECHSGRFPACLIIGIVLYHFLHVKKTSWLTWVLSRASEILGEHMQGRLWGGAFAVTPKAEVGVSLWRPLCLPGVSARQEPCSEQEQDWAFLAWWIFSCTGVFEINVFMCLRTYMKYGDLSTEIVACWCRQFPVFWGGWVCLFLFLAKACSFTPF